MTTKNLSRDFPISHLNFVITPQYSWPTNLPRGWFYARQTPGGNLIIVTEYDDAWWFCKA